MKKGIVKTNNAGYSSIECATEVVPLNLQDSKRVIDGDEVQFELKPDNTISFLKVLTRRADVYVGRVEYKNGNWVLFSDKPCLTPVYVKGISYLIPGVIVSVRIDPTHLTTPVYAKLERVIGQKEDPTFISEYTLAKFDLESVFDYKPLQWIKKNQLPLISESSSHIDLTHKPFLTIDGDSTKDLDDAICAFKSENGHTLYVAISDVSYFIKEGTELDICAYERGTSVYFSDKTTPMIPSELSTDILSLKEGIVRLAVICEITYDEKLNQTGYSFYRAKIKVHKRLNYDQAAAYMTHPQLVEDACPIVSEQITLLSKMFERYNGLNAKSDFNEDLPIKVRFFESDYYLEQEKRLPSHKLVEFCMLQANNCAAIQTIAIKKPFLRVQDAFDEEALLKVREYLGLSEFTDFEEILKSVNTNPASKKSAYILLKNLMTPAYYSHESAAHFSLGLSAYTHFTSPIRRYADLTVHRILLGEKTKRNLEQVSSKCSLQNKKARQSEKFHEDYVKKMLIAKNCRPMDLFNATVLNQTEKSVRVLLSDYGLIQVLSNRTLQDAGYVYNSALKKWGSLDYGTDIKVEYTGFFEDSFGYQIKLKVPEPL